MFLQSFVPTQRWAPGVQKRANCLHCCASFSCSDIKAGMMSRLELWVCHFASATCSRIQTWRGREVEEQSSRSFTPIRAENRETREPLPAGAPSNTHLRSDHDWLPAALAAVEGCRRDLTNRVELLLWPMTRGALSWLWWSPPAPSATAWAGIVKVWAHVYDGSFGSIDEATNVSERIDIKYDWFKSPLKQFMSVGHIPLLVIIELQHSVCVAT